MSISSHLAYAEDRVRELEAELERLREENREVKEHDALLAEDNVRLQAVTPESAFEEGYVAAKAELERLQHNFTLADVARQEAGAEVERLVVVVDNAEQRAEEAEATVDALRAALLHIVDSTHPADNAYSVARRALGEEA